MQETNITILTKEDLDFTKKNIDVTNVVEIMNSVNKDRKWLVQSTFIVFFDDNEKYIIIKNRYAENSEETNALLSFVKLLNKKRIKNYDN